MTDSIPKKEAVTEVRKACDQFSDLYFHLSKVLYERFGKDAAKEIVADIVAARAIERGEKLKHAASDAGLENNAENFLKVTDIPYLGWDASYGRFVCPFSESWVKRFADNPWFEDFAPLYCDVNDTLVHETYSGGKETQRIVENVLWGDDKCDRVYAKAIQPFDYKKRARD
jgi:hypothetical protein